jgi:bacterioferritin-associated ferredoxin
MFQVDRCICHNLTFEELLRAARDGQIVSAAELSRRTGFGTKCGSCVAYVKRALRTGEVVFHELLPFETLKE